MEGKKEGQNISRKNGQDGEREEERQVEKCEVRHRRTEGEEEKKRGNVGMRWRERDEMRLRKEERRDAQGDRRERERWMSVVSVCSVVCTGAVHTHIREVRGVTLVGSKVTFTGCVFQSDRERREKGWRSNTYSLSKLKSIKGERNKG